MELRQIAFRLSIVFVICLCMSFAVGLYSQNVALQRELAERPTTATNDELDKGFSDIYTTIGLISSRYRVIADTHMRTQHYAKPHTTPQHLCPECGDLRRVMREGIVWVPAARLKLLRAMERTSAGMPADMFVTNDPPDPLIDVVEELDSVLFFLRRMPLFRIHCCRLRSTRIIIQRSTRIPFLG
jgi:hypothetical protein